MSSDNTAKPTIREIMAARASRMREKILNNDDELTERYALAAVLGLKPACEPSPNIALRIRQRVAAFHAEMTGMAEAEQTAYIKALTTRLYALQDQADERAVDFFVRMAREGRALAVPAHLAARVFEEVSK